MSKERNKNHEKYFVPILLLLLAFSLGIAYNEYDKISDYNNSFYYAEAVQQISIERDAGIDSSVSYNQYILRDSVIINQNNSKIKSLRSEIYELKQQILIEVKQGDDISAQMIQLKQKEADLETQLKLERESMAALDIIKSPEDKSVEATEDLDEKKAILKILTDSLNKLSNQCY